MMYYANQKRIPLWRYSVAIPAMAMLTACGSQSFIDKTEPDHEHVTSTYSLSQPIDSTTESAEFAPDNQGFKDELYRYGISKDASESTDTDGSNDKASSGQPISAATTAKSDNDNKEGNPMTVLVLDESMMTSNQQAALIEAQATTASVSSNESMSMTDIEPPRMRVLYYGLDQAALTPDQQKEIQLHASFLAVHPNYQIQIHGHTDKQGHMAYNQKLSNQRAQRVADALMAAGVKAEQIETFSWGSSDPLLSASQYDKNRRVELIYLSDQVATQEDDSGSPMPVSSLIR